jgi:hypothetical protein
MGDSQNTTAILDPWTEAPDIQPPGDQEAGEALSLRVARFLRMCWSRRRMPMSDGRRRSIPLAPRFIPRSRTRLPRPASS